MIKKEKHLAYILNSTPKELRTISNDIANYYTTKKKYKKNFLGIIKYKNGEPVYRLLNPSIKKLKRIQKLIYLKVIKKITLLDCVYGGIKGRSHIINAKKHLGKKYRFTTDIKRFYPSIDNDMVYKSFVNLNFSHDVSRLLTLLTTYKWCLPQGTPTSLGVANLVFMPIDEEINKYCESNNIFYTRYVDDLTFSASFDFKKNTFEILKIIEKSIFNINHLKTSYKIGPINITGIFAKINLLKPRIEQKIKLKHPHVRKSTKIGLASYFKQLK